MTFQTPTGSDAENSNRRSPVFPREVRDVEAFALGVHKSEPPLEEQK